MKKTILLFSLVLSQFAFAQFPDSENIIYIECNGDSIAVDITEYQNMPIEILPSLFDCDNQDDWAWDNDDWNPNNPGIDNPGMGWDDSTDVENSVIEILCSNGESFEVDLYEMINMPSEEFIFSICGEEGIDEDWNGPDWDDDFWDFDSTDVDTPWGDEDDIQVLLAELEMACASGDYIACGALELFAECTNGNSEACEELIGIFESNEEEDDDDDDDDDNNWPWDNDDWDDDFWDFDSTEVEDPWGDEDDIQVLLAELEMACASGDYMACGALELFAECTNGNSEACEELIGIYEADEEEDDDDDNNWPWDNDGWDDSTDFDCPWEDGFPGAENNEGFDSAIFDNMMSLFVSMDMEEDEMVLIFEQSDVLISIIDASGIEFTPTLIDGYLVFGPFNIEDLYSIFMGDMNGNGIGWGLLRPSGAEVVADGVISEPSELLNGMFTISASLSLEENTAPLEVYNTTYFNLLGKEIKTLENGLYIKVMQTNKGQVAEKVYFRD
ncbi:MAG: hypothetical protein P8P86_05960 [Flavobacteriales bacterium]|nr:hypothetical protein [Flavobacteriales bacterium]